MEPSLSRNAKAKEISQIGVKNKKSLRNIWLKLTLKNNKK